MYRVLIAALLFPAFAADAAATAPPSVDEIVKQTNLAAYYRGDDGRSRVKMTITDRQKRTRVREFTVLRRDDSDGGKQKFFIHFHAPADVADMTFIVHKHLTTDDDRWLYLPDLDLEKRVAAADKRTSFAGSDFYYEDVSGRATDQDHHELLEVTDDYYVLKNTPKDAGSVEFGSYVMHIHKGTWLPMKVVFYDKSGAPHRTMKTLKVKKIQGHTTVTRASIEDAKAGTRTVVEYSDVKYDMGLPDGVFGKRSLRRPPVKYLR